MIELPRTPRVFFKKVAYYGNVPVTIALNDEGDDLKVLAAPGVPNIEGTSLTVTVVREDERGQFSAPETRTMRLGRNSIIRLD